MNWCNLSGSPSRERGLRGQGNVLPRSLLALGVVLGKYLDHRVSKITFTIKSNYKIIIHSKLNRRKIQKHLLV